MANNLIKKFNIVNILLLLHSIASDCSPINLNATESTLLTASSSLISPVNSLSSTGLYKNNVTTVATNESPSVDTVTRLIEYDETSYGGSTLSSKISSSTQVSVPGAGDLDFSSTTIDSRMNVSLSTESTTDFVLESTPEVINLNEGPTSLGSTSSPLLLANITNLSASIEDVRYNTSESMSLIDVRQVSSTTSTNFNDNTSDDTNYNTDVRRDNDEVDSNDQDDILARGRISRDKEEIEDEKLIENLLKKKPFGKFLSVEQKWDDLFRRFFEAKRVMTRKFTRLFFKDLEHYTDISVSPKCLADIKYAQDYTKTSSNSRWLMRMFDSFGKSEPGLIAGNVPNLGHVLQCVRVRAPSIASNDSFDERDFVKQTEALGERFRGKYCLVNVRPVMPPRPKLVSRYKSVLDISLLSNLTFMGQTSAELDLRKLQSDAPPPNGYDEYSLISNLSADYVPPFQSPLYQYMIDQNSILYTYTRQMGVCYPSSCSREDIRFSLQKTFDEYHQLVTLDYECEQEPLSVSDWLNTSRAVAFFILTTVVVVSLSATILKIYVFVPKNNGKAHMNANSQDAPSKQQPGAVEESIRDMLNVFSIDKCSGYLFIKTKPALTTVDDAKIENNHRSTAIDALKGFLILMFVYSQLVTLGSLPVPFLWSRWTDAMVPFFRAPVTQIFLNVPIWIESFYFISGYVMSYRIFDNCVSHNLGYAREGVDRKYLLQPFGSYVYQRYIRLVPPMLGMICLNYVWPHLSNGFVLNDQANKIQEPCDKFGWTNMLLFHNNDQRLNETCLWPTHVSAVQFQLHLLAYPIIYLVTAGLSSFIANHFRHHIQQSKDLLRSSPDSNNSSKYNDKFGHLDRSTASRSDFMIENYQFKTKHFSKLIFGVTSCLLLITFGIIYPAIVASDQQLIVPFIIDYPDYNNYQRVIELMYMPTYNHLIGYFMGILLALFVVFKRYFTKDACLHTGDKLWIWSTREDENSSDEKAPNEKLDCINAEQQGRNEDEGFKFASLLASIVSFVAIFVVLMSTFYWAGLGIEVTDTHTFMFVLLSKFLYLLPFTWLFYRHVATRKNSNDPWILTRFLVPLGRMSGAIYFSSYMVVWFDLLSSPYQWHPSHYFISEKYLELAFMTLLLAILSYSCFEGPIIASGHTARYISYRKRKLFSDINSVVVESEAAGKNSNATTTNIGNNKKTIAQQNILRIIGSDVVIDDHHQSAHSKGMRRLSVVDQKKLNAEMRANTSFASLSNLSDGGMIVMSLGKGNSTGNNTAGNSTTTLISNNNYHSTDSSETHQPNVLVRLSPSGVPTAPTED